MKELTLEQILNSLISSLLNKEIKSKQTAFYLNFESLQKAKEISSWETITKFINEKTNNTLTARTTCNMFQRAKKKAYNTSNRTKSDYKFNKKETQSSSKKPHELYSNTEWETIGVSSQRLIDDLNEYGLSPAEVKDWNCANDSARRKKLTELLHKMQKGK